MLKLVSSKEERQLVLTPSTYQNGMDLKLEDRVILSIVPEGYSDIKIVLPLNSTIKVYKGKLENELS